MFIELSEDRTGIDFSNDLQPDSLFNIMSYMYFYNGGGVATGDINGDGLLDVYMTGNQKSSRLYLNQGDMRFTDITDAANVSTNFWATGVSMVDINGDGLLDIYVCAAGYPESERRRNRLFVNQGGTVFEEMAHAYGLDDPGQTTHATFFDYDLDGDLDLFLLNHMHQFSGPNDPLPKRLNGEAQNTDALYENVWNDEKGHPEFKEVSQIAGITIEGFGLGVTVSDINLDGWPDIYVSNDFVSNDILYINNQDGTFANRIGEYIAAQSHNGMGTDVADINNDGYPEIVVCDMFPRDNRRRKLMAMNVGYDLFEIGLRMGYEPQYPRNTLQLHNGFSHDGTMLPFSEIGQLAGIHDTDWSWSTLFADFDHDGNKDLFITNGHLKDLTDLDFIVYRQQRTRFTTERQADSLYLHLLEQMPGVRKPNRLFRNNADLTFTDVTGEWFAQFDSYSNGAVYDDLDNDGDLDLIVNRVNEQALVMENVTSSASPNSSVTVVLNGQQNNPDGRGAKVRLYTSAGIQYCEQSNERGYMSSRSGRIHFGVAQGTSIDSIVVDWLGGRLETIVDVEIGSTIKIDFERSSPREPQVKHSTVEPLLNDEEINLSHSETSYPDHKYDPLIPRSYSTLGPAIAIGDINADGLDDFVMGGSLGYSTTIGLQEESGSFNTFELDSTSQFEDAGLLLFDVDNDGDLDLYAGSGGSEKSASLQDRLYLNNGRGEFKLEGSFGDSRTSCVAANDFDKDGDLDLFVGTRLIDGYYGASPTSFLYLNQGGSLELFQSPILDSIGMVTSALWTDFDNDQDDDLVIVGEWMAPVVLENNEGELVGPAPLISESASGWWNSIVGGDFDNDGDTDYVLGNYGLNSDYVASADYPIKLYSGFLDDNRSWDILITRGIQSDDQVVRTYPVHSRDQLLDRFNALKKEYTSYEEYAVATEDHVFGTGTVSPSGLQICNQLASVLLLNRGDQSFAVRQLPNEAQISPIHGIAVTDLNDDPYLDIVLGMNFYDNDVYRGRADASVGTCLLGDGLGGFEALGPAESGYFVNGNVRSVVSLMGAGQKPGFLVTRNNGDARFFTRSTMADEVYAPEMTESSKMIEQIDGSRRKTEFYYGSGYLSQSTRKTELPARQIQ